ncbi:MAG TPA: D-cysteine desulfhydrase family protein [Bryobacteraceae bacterium]|nr:D-cysteine desulfhydrase family protein [Bryobacteraceae bacterium]
MSIGSQSRFRLAALPTPLQELVNLRTALGGAEACPCILMKRDDLTGLALGGNKARKLEFLVGDAISQAATVLVTSGAVQSNHARMTASAARAAGMKAALVLTSDHEHPPVQGNLLLDKLLGAEIHFIPANTDPRLATGDQEAIKIAQVVEDLRQRGERPYLIPVGGSSSVGALGYVAGTLELVSQLFDMRKAPNRLYYANGSRGTQAGLVLGAKLHGAPYKIHGIAVSGGEPEKTGRALRIANGAAELLGVADRVSAEDFLNDESYIGPGYGIATPECLEAIHLLARAEGILLDPVYTGKAMAGMIDHIRRGVIAPDSTIIFLHTGGAPALFAHADRLF